MLIAFSTSTRRQLRATRAFTLIELLTVVAIIGVLAAILIPTVSSAQASAKATQCSGNLRQIAVATSLFASENKQKLPRQTDDFITDLWPYVRGTDAPLPALGAGDPPADLAETIFECPLVHDDTTDNKRSYGVNNHLATAPNARLTDLTTPANTLLYADVKAIATLNIDNLNPRHKNRAHIAYADGHVAASDLPPELVGNAAVYSSVPWLGQ